MNINRRDLCIASVAIPSVVLGNTGSYRPNEAIQVISPSRTDYSGWPTVTRLKNGRLIVVYSGGRDGHVCPFGHVAMMTSNDDGQSWTTPRVILDTPIDDRDAGILETSRGTLLVTTFSSLAYLEVIHRLTTAKALELPDWPKERVQRWLAKHRAINYVLPASKPAHWMLRSADGGVSWSAPYACLVSSPHGPIELTDGRLVHAGKDIWGGNGQVGLTESHDDGQTWNWVSQFRVRPGDQLAEYHEPHIVETSAGSLVVHLRNHNKQNYRELLQTESFDLGRTWSEPRAIGVRGYPCHMMKMRCGGILATYGHRRGPIGNQARVSWDSGGSWSAPILISDDGVSTDIGYPSTVELSDQTFLTIWYEVMHDSPMAVLRQKVWSLPSGCDRPQK